MPDKILVTREIPDAGVRLLKDFEVCVLAERPPTRDELLEAARERDIVVTNTPGVLDETTADVAFMLMLAAARRLGEGERMLRAGRWEWWGPKQLRGLDVWGKRLGVVGMGRIGQAVARRARGFGMEILYHNRSRNEEAEKELVARYLDLDDLLRESDFVSIHTPLTDETRHLIGERELGLMRE